MCCSKVGETFLCVHCFFGAPGLFSTNTEFRHEEFPTNIFFILMFFTLMTELPVFVTTNVVCDGNGMMLSSVSVRLSINHQ